MKKLGFNEIGIRRPQFDVVCTVLVVVSFFVPLLSWAKMAEQTPNVIGFKPIVKNIMYDKGNPVVGESVTVDYEYLDLDGDPPAQSIIKWSRNGVVVSGEISESYTPLLNTATPLGTKCDSSIDISVEITPMSLSGDPQIGDSKRSDDVTVKVPVVPNFTSPDLVRRNWIDADNYCRDKKMRLPTSEELQEMYNTNTIGGNNIQMASRYGWPLKNHCGGNFNNYWSSDDDGSSYHSYVNLATGIVSNPYEDNNRYNVTCIY